MPTQPPNPTKPPPGTPGGPPGDPIPCTKEDLARVESAVIRLQQTVVDFHKEILLTLASKA